MNKLPDTHWDPDNYRDGDGNGNATIDMGAYEYDAPLSMYGSTSISDSVMGCNTILVTKF